MFPVSAERGGEHFFGFGGLGADVLADGSGAVDDVVPQGAQALDADFDPAIA